MNTTSEVKVMRETVAKVLEALRAGELGKAAEGFGRISATLSCETPKHRRAFELAHAEFGHLVRVGNGDTIDPNAARSAYRAARELSILL